MRFNSKLDLEGAGEAVYGLARRIYAETKLQYDAVFDQLDGLG